MDGLPAAQAEALRAEHDALAARLAVRISVDQVQRGGVMTFFAVVSLGMTCKLAWDRWGVLPGGRPPEPATPLWFLLAAALTATLVGAAVVTFRRASVLRAEEGLLFERLRALRQRLELDT
jgi:hypothetical protein